MIGFILLTEKTVFRQLLWICLSYSDKIMDDVFIRKVYVPELTFDVKRIGRFLEAALCQKPVSGLTHTFYTYPARFSPAFAAAAIRCFSKPGDLVLDPYMGGGTTVVEAMVADRQSIGMDLNSLAVFVARVKTTRIKDEEISTIRRWADEAVPMIRYHYRSTTLDKFVDRNKIKNLNLSKSRFIKKAIAIALESIDTLPTEKTKNFAKCAVLNAGKWALDGRRSHTSLSSFRDRLRIMIHHMLGGMEEFISTAKTFKRTLIEGDAKDITKASAFRDSSRFADLVLTSPPYPGVHVLYHRWQVDGRKETPAPYWIAGCNDGKGASFYNFGSREQKDLTGYFQASIETLKSVRQVMKPGALMVQLIAFNNPTRYLPRYLDNMSQAGFEEAFPLRQRSNRSIGRFWRTVPNRRWHALLQGKTDSSREVVLVHRAV